jgi:dTDP-4-amino-4,6-dideoxygalactose transaminase
MHPYEARFAGAFGEGFGAFAFWKGRIALYAVLRALDLREGDEVLVPGYTCVVVPHAVRYAGAAPVYVDITPGGYNADPASVAARVTPRTRALIVQHTYGAPADLEALSTIAERHRLNVIEDCAHVLIGSSYRNRLLGGWGCAAFFSFQWSKPYTSGLGGMIVTRDERLAARLQAIQRTFVAAPLRRRLQLRLQYAIYRRMFRPRFYWLGERVLHSFSRVGLFVGSSSAAELSGKVPADLHWRMADFQMRAGLAQMARARDNAIHRRRLSDYYGEALQRYGWPPADVLAGDGIILLRYPIRVANKAPLLAQARAARIEVGSWFETPLHPLPLSDHPRVGYRVGCCPIAEATAAEVINLPLHERVTRAEAERIVQFIVSRAMPLARPAVTHA